MSLRGHGWTPSELPDLSGRTMVVTGASSGLGLETARGLAGAGARVVLAVRDRERGERAAAAIGGDTDVRRLDLADLASVRAFAHTWEEPLDVLVLNAGVMAVPLGRTVDGFELQIGTNHLGHFALALQLLPWVTDRVVTVSSAGAQLGAIDLDDLNWQHRRYRPWRAYGQSKLANLLFTLELTRRLIDESSDRRALSAHPGLSATPLQGKTASALWRALAPLDRVLGGSAANGALPTLYAATQDVPGGLYIGPDGRTATRRSPVVVAPPRAATDQAMARRLWQLSAELTGVPEWPPPR